MQVGAKPRSLSAVESMESTLFQLTSGIKGTGEAESSGVSLRALV